MKKESATSQDNLNNLIESKFLSMRILKRISENMHYEIFKYLNSRDLLLIRSTNLGGFQLTSNKLLRSRIQNYLPKFPLNINTKTGKIEMHNLDKLIKVMFGQTGNEVLDIRESIFEHIGFHNLMMLLALNSYIQGFKLVGVNQLFGEHMEIAELFEYFRFMDNLQILSLRGCCMGVSGMRIFVDHMKYIPNLKMLNLRSNRIREDGMKLFAPNMKFIPRLRVLNLMNNSIGKDGIENFGPYLSFIPNLLSLNLESNKMEYSGGQLLANYLKLISQLEILNLNNNCLRIGGIQAIASQFTRIPQLLALYLESNDLCPAGIHILSIYLKELPKLEILNLKYNQIHNSIDNLSQSLKFISNLRELNLEMNRLNQGNMQILLDNLSFLPQLRKLYLGYNRLSYQFFAYIKTQIPDLVISL